MRYNTNETKKTPDGKTVYRSRFYKPIPMRDDDLYIVTQTGDRLDSIAYKFYGDSRLWWIIASANNIHNAPTGIEDGLILRLPMNYIELSNTI
jgi:phage tail protein X